MNRRHAIVALCLGLIAVSAQASDSDTQLVYIGTRGAVASEQPQSEVAHGIYAIRLDPRTGRLTTLGLQVPLDRAAWLVTHPELPILYAATGLSAESVVRSFALDRASGKLTEGSKVSSGGSGATHLELDTSTATMFVAHFGSGDVTALPMRADGSLQNVVSSQRQYGTGPHRRQSSPHAHGLAIAPSRRHVLATDLGADRIFVYRFDRATRSLSPAQPALESTPPGSGPRHVLFDRRGNFLYLNSELTAELYVYRWDERKERLQLVQSLSAYPEGYSGDARSSSEIAMSRDGRFLYVSLRGDQDSIVVYAVHKRSGTLREIQRISTNGKSPWSLGLDPTDRWMLVTNEASNSVSLLGVDPATGMLSATNESLSIPKPVTVAFHRN